MVFALASVPIELQKRRKLILLLLGLPFFIQCNYIDFIPVIGLDVNGQPAQQLIPRSEYINRVYASVSSIEESTVTVLKKRAHLSCSSWKLRTVSVGIAASTTIGLGPIQVGAMPRFRMMFTNSLDPPLP